MFIVEFTNIMLSTNVGLHIFFLESSTHYLVGEKKNAKERLFTKCVDRKLPKKKKELLKSCVIVNNPVFISEPISNTK